MNENLNDVLSAKLTMEEHFLEKNKSLQSQLNEVCVTLVSFTAFLILCNGIEIMSVLMLSVI